MSLAPPPPAATALAALRAGNHRFVNELRSVDSLSSRSRRDALTQGQAPAAIILCCSDSRVPAEIVFDAGLGDLFVVRVAGNICAPSLVGSVEFAAATFGTRLVVVMGHSNCGAVKATIDTIASGGAPASQNVRDIVERIEPAVAELTRLGLPGDKLLESAIRANVRHTTSHLRHGSRVLESLVAEQSLLIVGAEYSLETGVVDFFDVPGERKSASGQAA